MKVARFAVVTVTSQTLMTAMPSSTAGVPKAFIRGDVSNDMVTLVNDLGSEA